jgi:serine/threonine protein kinase
MGRHSAATPEDGGAQLGLVLAIKPRPWRVRVPRSRRARQIRSGDQPLAPGAVVAERYRVQRMIAAGAMGEVWAGEHVQLRTGVALKALLREARANPEVVARFSREALLLGQIRSDHVARAYDFVSDRRHGLVLVMELVDGPALAEVLACRSLTVEEGIELGMEVAMALREIHEAGVVHRDVKPANIILKPLRDGRRRAVFVDLGVGRSLTESGEHEEPIDELTSVDRALGTPEYMAPEQILSSRTVLPAADLYALGAILYRAVAGRHVFAQMQGRELLSAKLTQAPSALVTGRTDRVAIGFEDVVARALAGDPAERYEIADEILADLSLLRDAARRAARASVSNVRVASASALASPKRAVTAPTVLSIVTAPDGPPNRTRNRAPWTGRAIAFGAALSVGTLLVGLTASSAAPASPNVSTPLTYDRLSAGDGPPCAVISRQVESTPDGRRLIVSLSCDEGATPGALAEADAAP